MMHLPTRRKEKDYHAIASRCTSFHHRLSNGGIGAIYRRMVWFGPGINDEGSGHMAPVRETLRAAAILKKRAGKKNQQSGDGSSEEKSSDYDTARESLLNGFRNLRAVSSRDFEDGIAFFLGDASADGAIGQGGNGSRHSHYHSSDSSDDEA